MITAETILAIVGGLVAVSIGIVVITMTIYHCTLAFFDLRREVTRIKILALMGFFPANEGWHTDVGNAIEEWVESDYYAHREQNGGGYDGVDGDVMQNVRRIVERVLEQIVTNQYPKRKKKETT